MTLQRRGFNFRVIGSNNMADRRTFEVRMILLAIYYCGYHCLAWLLGVGRDMNNEQQNKQTNSMV
jgi:hypothetical protein